MSSEKKKKYTKPISRNILSPKREKHSGDLQDLSKYSGLEIGVF